MAILAECPICRKIQSKKNRKCVCGEDLITAKRSQRVKYHIHYRKPDGKQRKIYVGNIEEMNGYSIEDAKKTESKYKVLKTENKLFDIKPDSKMRFNELTEWYLNLESVKVLASYNTIKYSLDKLS